MSLELAVSSTGSTPFSLLILNLPTRSGLFCNHGDWIWAFPPLPLLPSLLCNFLSKIIFPFLTFISLTTSSYVHPVAALSPPPSHFVSCSPLLIIFHFSFHSNFLCPPSITVISLSSLLPSLFPAFTTPSCTLLFGRIYSSAALKLFCTADIGVKTSL